MDDALSIGEGRVAEEVEEWSLRWIYLWGDRYRTEFKFLKVNEDTWEAKVCKS